MSLLNSIILWLTPATEERRLTVEEQKSAANELIERLHKWAVMNAKMPPMRNDFEFKAHSYTGHSGGPITTVGVSCEIVDRDNNKRNKVMLMNIDYPEDAITVLKLLNENKQ